MAYVVVASVLRNVTTSDGDCTVIQELALFLSWTQVNSRAATAITTAKFFPLTILYYKRVIDQLGSIVCEGSRALGVTAYLIGQGSSLQSVNDWVQTYSSDTFVLKVPNNPRRVWVVILCNVILSSSSLSLSLSSSFICSGLLCLIPVGSTSRPTLSLH
jgi:hypothetical protein